MQAKRGQVTLFIIIAIVVVAAALLVWQFWPRIQEAFMTKEQAQAFLAAQVGPLKDSIHYCISSVSEDLLRTQGLQAGYYDPRPHHLYAIDYAGLKWVIMYKDENKVRVNKLPSLEQIKAEFALALEREGNARIDSCLNDFKEFKRKMHLESGHRSIGLEIAEENVIVKVDWPITLRKAAATTKVEPEDITLSIPLGKVWGFANDIVNYEVQQTNFEDVADAYNWNNPDQREGLDLDSRAGPTYHQRIYLITTREPCGLREEPYLFYFAVDRI